MLQDAGCLWAPVLDHRHRAYHRYRGAAENAKAVRRGEVRHLDAGRQPQDGILVVGRPDVAGIDPDRDEMADVALDLVALGDAEHLGPVSQDQRQPGVGPLGADPSERRVVGMVAASREHRGADPWAQALSRVLELPEGHRLGPLVSVQ